MSSHWRIFLLSILLCSICDQSFATSSSFVKVSLSGKDEMSCGTTVPCQSVQYVLSNNWLQDGGTIHITESSTDRPLFNCSTKAISSSISFILDGGNSLSYIGCSAGDTIISFSSETNINPIQITFKNIEFKNTKIKVSDVSVITKRCVFKDSKIAILSMSETLTNISFTDIKWISKAKCSDDYKCTPNGQLYIKGSFSDIYVGNNNFLHTKVNIEVFNNCNIMLFTNHHSSNPEERPVQATVFIALKATAENSTINVMHCTFMNQFNWNPIDSVANIFMSALLFRLFNTDSFNYSTNNVQILVYNSTFVNNERALTFQGYLEHIEIQNCTFRKNIAVHAGAAILQILFSKNPTLIENCLFENNAAGVLRSDNVRPPGPYFSVRGDEAVLDSECCKGTVSMIGKGGAIRLQNGSMILENSTFRNNTARILGGTLFVDRSTDLKIQNCNFINPTQSSILAQQGDIVYSSGKIKIDGGNFKVLNATDHISLLRHSGYHWSIAVHNIDIECPIGHRLRVMNNSAFKVIPYVGLLKSYMLDQLAYFCESCPRNKYSTDYGSLKYKLNPGVYDYYSLMINGLKPSSEFAGTYKYNDITCQDCPYGGNCDDHIRALPNFWGYKMKGSIYFQQCPRGYCCSSIICPAFNACASHRTGVLCGQCENGYTEALFSSKCIPDEECGPAWIWPFSAGMGILYMLFLFYQKDMRDFIFHWPTECFDSRRSKSFNKKEAQYAICGDIDIVEMHENKKLSQTSDVVDLTDIQENGQNGDIYSSTETNRNAKSDNDIKRLENQNSVTDTVKQNRTGSCDIHTASTISLHDENTSDAIIAEPTPKDKGAIYLIIIMYFFQDSQLFHIKTASATPENSLHATLRTVLLGLFKFRLEVAHFVDNVCLTEGLSAHEKLLTKTLLVPYTLLLFCIVYLCYMCVSKLRANTRENEEKRELFLSRLCSGFMLALMFTYQRLATTTFKLLNCVPVGDKSVLFLDGSVECYEGWQFGVMAYAICCIVPFSIVLLLGPSLLKEGRISLPTFFIACLIPLPFVIFWVISRMSTKYCCLKPSYTESSNRSVVLKVLQGPLKDLSCRPLGSICWAGVLILRRLVLVLLYTFINHSLIRIICMLLVCFTILLHHVHVQPYKEFSVNIAGSVSISALMLVGGINLVRAGFEVSEYVPIGPNEVLMYVMKNTENIMMLWLPAVIMGVVLLGLLIKIVITIVIKCSKN